MVLDDQIKTPGPIPLIRIQNAIESLNPNTSFIPSELEDIKENHDQPTSLIKENDPWFHLLSQYTNFPLEERLKIKHSLINNSPFYDQDTKTFLGPHFLEKEFVLNFRTKFNEASSLCRPWSRLDLLERLSTFKTSTWSSDSFPSQLCAERGWVNISRGVLECRSCKSIIQEQGDSDPSNKPSDFLASSHLQNCPWKLLTCFSNLYSIPESSLIGLKAAFEKHFKLLEKHLQDSVPSVQPSLDSELLSRCFENYGIPVDSKSFSISTLSLYGWFPLPGRPGPRVKCWLCHRVLGLWNFSQLSSENSSEELPILDAASQHKHTCPYINEKQWPTKWLSALTQPFLPSSLPDNHSPIDSSFDWNSAKSTVSQFRSTLESSLQKNPRQRRRVARIARRPPVISASSLREQIKRRYEKLRSHDALKET